MSKKNIKKIIKEAQRLADSLIDKLLEASQNEIPEVPDTGKKSGEAVKKEIEGEPTDSGHEPLEEHEDNFMPEVPDEGKTAGADIKKAIVTAINPKLEKLPNVQQPKIDNELPDGVKPDSVSKSLNKMEDDIAESIMRIINSKKKVIKEDEELTLDDLSDYTKDMGKEGFSDKGKLQGMLDRAKLIAKKQGKEGDKKTIIGIFQSFFKAK